MMRNRRQLGMLLGLAASASMGASVCGCQALHDGGIFARHVSDDHRDRAQERWDRMRGNVELQVAEQHFRSGRLKESGKALQHVLSMSPQNVGAYKLATRLYIEQGELARAREAIAIALQHSMDDAEAEYLAGIVAQRYGEMDRALEHYIAAQLLSPYEVEYVLAVAETWMALDKPTKALEVVEGRLTDFDGCGAIWMLAARLCRAVGLKGPAVEYCLEAHRLDQGDGWSEVEIGLTLIWAERLGEAIGILRPLVDESLASSASGDENTERPGPVSPSVVQALARAYMAEENWGEARAVLKPVMSKNATDATAWCLYTRASLMAGDVGSAREAISKLNRHRTPTAETLLLQAYVSFWLGDYPAVSIWAHKALQHDEDLRSAQWLIARSRLASMGEDLGDVGDATRPLAEVPPAIPETRLAGSKEYNSSQALLDALAAEDTFGEMLPAEVPIRPVIADSTRTADALGGEQP